MYRAQSRKNQCFIKKKFSPEPYWEKKKRFFSQCYFNLFSNKNAKNTKNDGCFTA